MHCLVSVTRKFPVQLTKHQQSRPTLLFIRSDQQLVRVRIYFDRDVKFQVQVAGGVIKTPFLRENPLGLVTWQRNS